MDAFQGNLNASLPLAIQLARRSPDVDVDEPSSGWTLRDRTTKIRRTIRTIPFDDDGAFENQTASLGSLDRNGSVVVAFALLDAEVHAGGWINKHDP